MEQTPQPRLEMLESVTLKGFSNKNPGTLLAACSCQFYYVNLNHI